jgi:hypothetical protein
MQGRMSNVMRILIWKVVTLLRHLALGDSLCSSYIILQVHAMRCATCGILLITAKIDLLFSTSSIVAYSTSPSGVSIYQESQQKA